MLLQEAPLDQWLKTGRKLGVAQVLRIGREIAEGLAAAHERGLIHRDVKPGNIWLDSTHKGRVKILDFGLARSGVEDVQLTRSGAIVGTPAYMSLEQARGEKVDARSDLFSLGCVLYKLCTGAMPFAGDTTMALLMSLALDHPKTVRELNPDMPVALSNLVTRLLEKAPAKRPQSAREVIRAIQAISRALASSSSLDGRAARFIPAVGTKPAGINPAARTATIAAPPSSAPASDGKKP
jgi:serine/threonine protein kinase